MQREFGRHSYPSSSRLDDLSRHWEELLRDLKHAVAERSLTEVAAELITRLEQNLRFDYLGFGIFNPSKNVITVMLQVGGYQFPSEVSVLENSLGAVLHRRQVIEVQDVDTESGYADLVDMVKAAGFRSFRVLPLYTEKHMLGTFGVARRVAGPFPPDDVQYLEHVGQLISLVLENAVMVEALGREKARLETLLGVNNALMSSLDMERLFREISESIRRIVRQDYTHVALYDSAAQAMKFYIFDSSGRPAVVAPEHVVPVRECPAGIAFLQGEAKRFDAAELQLINSDYTRGLLAHGIRSMCCFPLVSRGRRLGVLGLASLQGRACSEDDLVLLTQIAAQVAVAVDNARSYEEITRFKNKLAKEKSYLEEEILSEHNFGELIGNSAVLKRILRQVEIAAPSDATVLITGETGTGKELVARAVHRLSSRREGNFIKLNCAAIPTGLLESELFGHERGAFTGAISQKIGRLELADRGTLFLDEIGEIPMELQPKLLRVLQDHEFERLGGNRTIRVNVRLVAATNRDLAQAVNERQFRSDLFYRLNVFPIQVPPLRERSGDIPLLVRHFVQKFAGRMGKNIESIPTEILREFEEWSWPGNVRELENFIERSVILTQGSTFFAPVAELRDSSPDRSRQFGTSLQDVEREYILRTLRESGGVIAGVHGAAARLGMKRTTLQSRMQKLGITKEEYQA